MRKVLSRLMSLFLMTIGLIFCLAIPMVALAEDTVGGLPTAFFSWETIGTFAGAVSAVVFLVQLLKVPIDRVWKIPTQFVVYVVSVGVLLLAQAFVPALGGLTLQTGILCVFNGALVALAAMSAYEVLINKVETQQAATAYQETLESVEDFELTDAETEKIAAAVAAKMTPKTIVVTNSSVVPPATGSTDT